jgi:hypothetical protein
MIDFTPTAFQSLHNPSSFRSGNLGLLRKQLTRLNDFSQGLAGFTKQEERRNKKQVLRSLAKRDELKSRVPPRMCL